MSLVEILSGIRLNLASFEQFVSIACSLADDNPAIQRGIYEATKEVRSSGQLIDHLRSLFNHQQATELERQHQLLAQSNSSTPANSYNSWTAPVGFGPSSHDRTEQHQWPTTASYPYRHHLAAGHVEDDNLQYFTYTNQLALIRASKCLVANVAKILYLTDEIVLKGSAQQAESQQQQQQHQRAATSPTSSQHHRIQEPVASDLNQANLSDRLDNVANYSQLLRSFSELSCDLVDLGYCIMAARRSRQLAHNKRALSNCRSKHPQHTPSPWPTPAAAAAAAAVPDYDPMSGRRATSERQMDGTSSADCYPSSASYRNANNTDPDCEQQQQQQQRQVPPTMRRQAMLIRPSSSMLFASALPGGPSTAVGLGSDFGHSDTYRASLGGVGGGGGGPLRPLVGEQQLIDGATSDLSAQMLPAEQSRRRGSYTHQDLDELQLAAQIQDMQVLFQVNRLIIDRSILLLLSASKCCLGQGSERHYGLEARHSIGVQIRVSISIIMALVKCSVFGLYAPASEPSSALSPPPTLSSPITLPTGANSQQTISGALLPLGTVNSNNVGNNELQLFDQQQQQQPESGLAGHFNENSNNRQQHRRSDRPPLANYPQAKFNRDDLQQRPLGRHANNSYWADSTVGSGARLNYANNQFVPTSAPGLANIAGQPACAGAVAPTKLPSFCNYLPPDEQAGPSSAADQQKQRKQQQQHNNNYMAHHYNGQAILYDELISQHLAGDDAQWLSVGPGRIVGQQRRNTQQLPGSRRGPLAVATDHQQQQQHPFRVSTLEGHLGGHESELGASAGAKLATRSTTTTKQFDIVNYFLLTANGTPSAHDAIHGLQLLIEPFEKVSNQDELAGELDEALEFVASGHFYRLAKQRQLYLRHPLSAVAASKTNYNQSPQDARYLAGHEGPPETGLGCGRQQLTSGDNLVSAGPAPESSEPRRQPAAVQQFGYTNTHQRLLRAAAAVDKENQNPATSSQQQQQQQQQQQHVPRMAATNYCITSDPQALELLEQMDLSRPVALMNKRQLVKALNLTFLGEIKANLVKGLHEFTDCAYTKHESRETILSLLAYVKFQLNKFVRLIYRLRRRSGSLNEPNQLALLRQIARQLVEACAELDHELKTLAVEQSDELDRCNTNLDLIKKLKHHCLVGDVAKERAVSGQFGELAEQLIETCKMLNQIAPTNKIKITTKVLATWFQLNLRQLLNSAHCLSESPRSREAKDCAWAYIQVWSSFYDDFCQLARQVAYLVHSKSAHDAGRSARGALIKEQIGLSKMSATGGADTDLFMDSLLLSAPFETGLSGGGGTAGRCGPGGVTSSLRSLDSVGASCGGGDSAQSSQQSLNNNNTNTMSDNCQQQIGSSRRQYCSSSQQPVHSVGVAMPPNDSPRSLDHYHGFGPNYRRSHDQSRHNHDQHHFQQQLHHQHQLTGSDSGTPTTRHLHHNTTVSTMSPPRIGFGNGDDDPGEQLLTVAIDSDQLSAHPGGACTRLTSGDMHQASYIRSPYIEQESDDCCGEPASYDCSGCLQSDQAARSPLSVVSSLDRRTSGLELSHLEQQQQPYRPIESSQSYPHQSQQQQQHHRLSHRPLASSKLMTMVSVDPGAASIEPPSVPARQIPQGAIGHNQQQQQQQRYDGGVQPMPRRPRPPPPPPPQALMNSYNIGALHESGIHHRRTGGGAKSKSGQRRHGHLTQEDEADEVVVVEEVASGDGDEDEEGQSEQEDELAHLNAPSGAGSSVRGQVGGRRHASAVAPTSVPPGPAADQQSIISSTIEPDKWSDSEADAIVRGARETAQMALSMYQFTRGEGDLNTTQDLFTQAELFAEEANELYKEVRCFSYKVPAGDLKKELLFQLSTIPALVQQLQFTVKNPTVGKAATFAKVDSVIRETKSLMEAVNRVVEATLSCRQHYNMATASLRKRTRTLSPSYRGDKGGFEFDSISSSGGRQQGGGAFGGFGGRHTSGASGSMGSEPDI